MQINEEAPKRFHRIKDRKQKVKELRNKDFKGADAGFASAKDYISFKKGSYTIIAAAPTSGKSEYVFETALNLAIEHGWTGALFMPESGDTDEVIAELCHKFVKKPFYNGKANSMTDDELNQAFEYLDRHLVIIECSADVSVVDILELVKEIEREDGVHIDFTVIDNLNDTREDLHETTGRQDLYTEKQMTDVRRDAQINNRHHILVTHASRQIPITQNGITFYPPISPNDVRSGTAIYRKAMQYISLWRPPYGLNDASGMPYEMNEVHVFVLKSKPKGVGRKGNFILYLNTHVGRFYERVSGKEYYAFDYAKKWDKSYGKTQLFN
jgi:hypothetical protein